MPGAPAVIRPARSEDAAGLLEIYGPFVESSHTSFEEETPARDEMARRIAVGGADLPWLVLEGDGVILGYAYASRHRERAAYRWTVEVAVYIREETRRHGAASALYAPLHEILKRMGLCNALAIIALPNPASVGFHEAWGYRRVAHYPDLGFKMGAWRDVGHWLLRLRDPEIPPAPLRTLEEVRTSGEWTALLAAGQGRFSAG